MKIREKTALIFKLIFFENNYNAQLYFYNFLFCSRKIIIFYFGPDYYKINFFLVNYF